MLFRSVFAFLLVLVVANCGGVPSDQQSTVVLKPASFKDLPGWNTDDVSQAIPALRASCEILLKRDPGASMKVLAQEAGRIERWQEACYALGNVQSGTDNDVRRVLEEQFDVWMVTDNGKKDGLFTGYYEASLKGSRLPSVRYRYPLHKRPDDLVMVHLGEFREHLKGERIAGRVIDGTLKPYETREQIVAGQWPHDKEVLAWVDSPVDAFFVQIQGSGLIELEGGGTIRIGYAGQNGHPYYAIGRELIARGYLAKEDVSMQSIRDWLERHPAEAGELMNTNKSYVFFKEIPDGPVGGAGIALTPGRSLAVDHTLLPYHVPVWVASAAPIEGAQNVARLMVAQDTGGAIRGAVRGDVFWGFGEHAERLAGAMNAKGRMWVLLPKQ